MTLIGRAEDVGTKYSQVVTPETQSHARSGVRMEDASLVLRNGSRVLLLAVADGHGSLQLHSPGVFVGGREAADAALSFVRSNPSLFSSSPYPAFLKAHESIRTSIPGTVPYGKDSLCIQRRNGKKDTVTAGTTLSVLTVDLKTGACHSSFVGDSLILVVPSTGDPWFTGNPHDTTDAEESKRLRSVGVRKTGRHFDMKIGPGREPYSVQLSRCLGHFGNDSILKTPSVCSWSGREWSYSVLATDGIWNHISPSLACQIVRTHDPQEAADKILQVSIRCQGHKPRDNATVLVVKRPTSVKGRGESGGGGCCTIM